MFSPYVQTHRNIIRLEGLLKAVSSFSIPLCSPWSLDTQADYVKQFFMYGSFPAPFVLGYPEGLSGEVLDGHKRLHAIRNFMDNQVFLMSVPFAPELNCKYYCDMPEVIQRYFTSALVDVMEVHTTSVHDPTYQQLRESFRDPVLRF